MAEQTKQPPFDIKRCVLPTVLQISKEGYSKRNDTNRFAHANRGGKERILLVPKDRRNVFYGEQQAKRGKRSEGTMHLKQVNMAEAAVCPEQIHMLAEDLRKYVHIFAVFPLSDIAPFPFDTVFKRTASASFFSGSISYSGCSSRVNALRRSYLDMET